MTTTAATDPITTVPRDVLLDLHRRMVRIRLFEEEAGRLMEGGPAARLPAPLRRPGGVRRGRHGEPARRRRHHLHAPRPRPRRREGRRPQVHVRRAVRQGHRLLQGPRRQHAHQRPVASACSARTASSAAASRTRSARRSRRTTRAATAVAVPFFGDGATNIGVFHESANIAAVMHLPVVFVCENNGYAEFTPQDRHMLLKDVADRAAAYGMPAVIVDGMDVVAVYLATKRAGAERARRAGPVAARGEDLPLLRPPGRQGPAHAVPHAGGDRRVEGPRRDRRARGPADRERASSTSPPSRRSGRTPATRSSRRSSSPRTARIPIRPTCSTTSTRPRG